MAVNLLDLPPHVLEKIFLNCFGYESPENPWKITKITETCKFLKEFVENSSRLMENLCLKTSDASKENREILQALVASKRKYRHISIPVKENWVEKNVIFKKIFDKSGGKMKTVDMECLFTNAENFFKFMKFFENLKGVESINIKLYESSPNITLRSREQMPQLLEGFRCKKNDFEHLRMLVMDFHFPLTIIMLDLFSTCRVIETLDLSCNYMLPDFPYLRTIIANSCASLKNIRFNFTMEDDEIVRFNFDFLKEITLNLQSLNLCCNWKIDNDFFKEFLSTQEKLEALQIDCSVESNFITNITDVLYQLGKLKKLSINLKNELFNQMPCKTWNFPDLEELELNLLVGSSPLPNEIQKSIFQLPNNNLKLLKFNHLGLKHKIFKQITRKCKNLRILQVYDENLTCNDIIRIFKNFKELEVLDIFVLGPIGPDWIDTDDERMVLSKIQHITFKFYFLQDYIGFLQSTFKFIHSLTRLDINIWYFHPHDLDAELPELPLLALCDCLTKELPNLEELKIWFDAVIRITWEKPVLLHIQSNVNRFNKNPEQFKFNSKPIQDWLE